MHGGFSALGFDLIPVVGAEVLPGGIAETFCEYLSVIKHADYVSAISENAAASFRAFNEMLVVEGIAGPEVRAHLLPTEVPSVGRREMEQARASLELTGAPLVLAVGSHEPRKNHLAVLEASERLWSHGLSFELLMIGKRLAGRGVPALRYIPAERGQGDQRQETRHGRRTLDGLPGVAIHRVPFAARRLWASRSRITRIRDACHHVRTRQHGGNRRARRGSSH